MGMWKVHKAQLAKAEVHIRDLKPPDACPRGQWDLATETKLDRGGNMPTGRLAHKEENGSWERQFWNWKQSLLLLQVPWH